MLPRGRKREEGRRLEPPIFTCLISVLGLGGRAAAFSARVLPARKGHILPLPSPSMKGRHRNGRRATYLQRGDTGSGPRGRALDGRSRAFPKHEAVSALLQCGAGYDALDSPVGGLTLYDPRASFYLGVCG